MNVHGSADPIGTDVGVVEEVLRVLGKGQRALQMYLPNNPVYQRTLQQVTDAFTSAWRVTNRLVLDIQEDEITWEGVPVFRQASKAEGLAWQLFKDGLRQVTFVPGVEDEEVLRFLRVVNRARMLHADSADDLLTLLWEQEFALVAYTFVEVSGDSTEFTLESGSRSGSGTGTGGGRGDARAEVAAADSPAAGTITGHGGGSAVVTLGDFDATLYFLDDAEIRLIQADLADEYRRDIREAAIDALLDILETQREPAVRREVIELLEEVLPAQLSTGGFRAVARILRELRIVAVRAPGLDGDLHAAVLSFEDRLSSPAILEQLFKVLADNATRPSDEDVGEVLRELKPAALPVVLRHLGQITDQTVRSTLEASVDAIARGQPEVLASLITSGDEDALVPAIALAARLGLSQLVPAIVGHLQTGDEPLRLAAVRALGEFATPTAVAAIELALGDPQRTVRQAALTLLIARGGSGGTLRRLEGMLFESTQDDWERSERRAMFEAYGTLAGAAAIPKLRELLEPRGMFRRRVSADVRASALFALAKVRTADARQLVESCSADKEPVVRSAANAALREWRA